MQLRVIRKKGHRLPVGSPKDRVYYNKSPRGNIEFIEPFFQIDPCFERENILDIKAQYNSSDNILFCHQDQKNKLMGKI